MGTLDQKIEHEPAPKDISAEFLSMRSLIFLEFLKTQGKEPFLSIITDWKDVWAANRLKAFLEDPSRGKQKRSATIRCTVEQHREAANAFSSGVKWGKIEKQAVS